MQILAVNINGMQQLNRIKIMNIKNMKDIILQSNQRLK